MNYIDSKIIQVLELRNDAGDITNPVAAGVLDGSSITASFYHLCCSLLQSMLGIKCSDRWQRDLGRIAQAEWGLQPTI